MHDRLASILEARFGPLNASLRSDLDFLTEEDLECIESDLSHYHDLSDVAKSVGHYYAKQLGRLEGMRLAVVAVLGIRDDELARELYLRAEGSQALEELSEIIRLAASPLGQTFVN